MKVSLIIPVLNSHEVLRRHILYWKRMDLPDDVEILIMDDGSDPPLEDPTGTVTIHQTHETRPWTSSIARNRGAELAEGHNLLFVDVDYIVPRSVFMDVRAFNGHRMQFSRQFAILDEFGQFTQKEESLLNYGLLPKRYEERGALLPPHPNMFAMRRDVFFDIGGYDEKLVLRRPYPQGEDNLFKRRWAQYQKAGKGQTSAYRPTIYMFPCGQFCGDVDYNPHNLFHQLSRKTKSNVFYKRQLRKEGKL